MIFRAILTEIRVFEVARSFRNWRKKTKIAASTKLKAVVALCGIVLRGDFLQNRVLGAQNQSDARMRN